MVKLRFSTVVDSDPKFRLQSLNLISTLIGTGTAEPSDIIVHLVGAHPQSLIDAYAWFGITMASVDGFGDPKSPYCNKLLQLTSPALVEADYVVLLDADTAFSKNIRSEMCCAGISARTVDCPNPPLVIQKELLERSGISAEPEIVKCGFNNEPTFASNCNGGVYLLNGSMFSTIGPIWTKWAQWMILQEDLLLTYVHHADQLGFCFAAFELGDIVRVQPLPHNLNFPTHLDPSAYTENDNIEAGLLHYHWKLNTLGLIETIGMSEVDRSITRANNIITEFRNKRFCNQVFWDFRYKYHAELGSGIGSRGATLEYKKNVLAPYLAMHIDDRVLDIGCGDLELLAEVSFSNYTGLDLSEEAINLCRQKRPDWQFIMGSLQSLANGDAYDLVLCLDVLIHMPNIEIYTETVRMIVSLCRSHLIASGYNVRPSFESHMVFYYEPLIKTFEYCGCPRESIEIIGRYHDADILLVNVLKRNASEFESGSGGRLKGFTVRLPKSKIREITIFMTTSVKILWRALRRKLRGVKKWHRK